MKAHKILVVCVFFALSMSFVLSNGAFTEEELGNILNDVHNATDADFVQALNQYLSGDTNVRFDSDDDTFKEALEKNYNDLSLDAQTKILLGEKEFSDYKRQFKTKLLHMYQESALESNQDPEEPNELLTNYIAERYKEIYADKEAPKIFISGSESDSLTIDRKGNLVGKHGAVIDLTSEAPLEEKPDLRIDSRIKEIRYDSSTGAFTASYSRDGASNNYLELTWDTGQMTRDSTYVTPEGKVIEDVSLVYSNDHTKYSKEITITHDEESGDTNFNLKGSTEDVGFAYHMKTTDGIKAVLAGNDEELKATIQNERRLYLSPHPAKTSDVSGEIDLKVTKDGDFSVKGVFEVKDFSEGIDLREDARSGYMNLDLEYDNPQISVEHKIRASLEEKLNSNPELVKLGTQEAAQKAKDFASQALSFLKNGDSSDASENSGPQPGSSSVLEAQELINQISASRLSNALLLGEDIKTTFPELANNPVADHLPNAFDEVMKEMFSADGFSAAQTDDSEIPSNTLRYRKYTDPLGQSVIDIASRSDTKWKYYDIQNAKGTIRTMDVASTTPDGKAYVTVGNSYIPIVTSADGTPTVNKASSVFQSRVSVTDFVVGDTTWTIDKGSRGLAQERDTRVNVWVEQRFISGSVGALAGGGLEGNIARKYGASISGSVGGAKLLNAPAGSDKYAGDFDGVEMNVAIDPQLSGSASIPGRFRGPLKQKIRSTVAEQAGSTATQQARQETLSTGTLADQFESGLVQGIRQQFNQDPRVVDGVNLVQGLRAREVSEEDIRTGLQTHFGFDAKTSGQLMDLSWVLNNPDTVKDTFRSIDGVSASIGYGSPANLVLESGGTASFGIGSNRVAVPRQLANLVLQGAIDEGPKVTTQTPVQAQNEPEVRYNFNQRDLLTQFNGYINSWDQHPEVQAVQQVAGQSGGSTDRLATGGSSQSSGSTTTTTQSTQSTQSTTTGSYTPGFRNSDGSITTRVDLHDGRGYLDIFTNAQNGNAYYKDSSGSYVLYKQASSGSTSSSSRRISNYNPGISSSSGNSRRVMICNGGRCNYVRR